MTDLPSTAELRAALTQPYWALPKPGPALRAYWPSGALHRLSRTGAATAVLPQVALLSLGIILGHSLGAATQPPAPKVVLTAEMAAMRWRGLSYLDFAAYAGLPADDPVTWAMFETLCESDP